MWIGVCLNVCVNCLSFTLKNTILRSCKFALFWLNSTTSCIVRIRTSPPPFVDWIILIYGSLLNGWYMYVQTRENLNKSLNSFQYTVFIKRINDNFVFDHHDIASKSIKINVLKSTYPGFFWTQLDTKYICPEERMIGNRWDCNCYACLAFFRIACCNVNFRLL